MDFAPIAATLTHSTWLLFAIPITIASIITPIISSITAPDIIVTPSGDCIFRLSESMRADIPTDVAVDTTPRNRHIGCVKPY